MEDAKNLGKVLDKYKDKYYSQVLALVFVTYLLYPFVKKLCIKLIKIFAFFIIGVFNQYVGIKKPCHSDFITFFDFLNL